MNAKPEIKPILRDLVELITETRGSKPPSCGTRTAILRVKRLCYNFFANQATGVR
jgi:hypothetical protein